MWINEPRESIYNLKLMHHLKLSLLAYTLSTTKKKKKKLLKELLQKLRRGKKRRILSIRNIKEYYQMVHFLVDNIQCQITLVKYFHSFTLFCYLVTYQIIDLFLIVNYSYRATHNWSKYTCLARLSSAFLF